METAVTEAKLNSQYYGAIIGGKLNGFYQSLNNSSKFFSNIYSYPESERRTLINTYIKKIFEESPEFQALWTIWEPNSIDSYDEQYLKLGQGIKSYGSFGTSWYRDVQTNIIKNIIPYPYDYDGDYYKLPKQTLKPQIINPYFYSYDGVQATAILETSIVFPIIVNGSFKGVIGADISLDFLQKMITKIKPYGSGYAIMLSNSGMRIAQNRKEMIGINFWERNNLTPEQVEYSKNAVKNGEEFHLEKIAYSTGIKSFQYYSPIKIAEINNPWYIGIIIPLDEFESSVTRLVIIMSLLGLVFMVGGIVLTVRLSNRIVEPINNIASIATQISEGKSMLVEVNSKDEVGILANAFNRMTENLSDIINQMNRTNELFIITQNTAKISSWELDLSTTLFTWMLQIDQLFEMKHVLRITRLSDLESRIHEEDKFNFKQAFKNSIESKYPLIISFRFKLSDGTYRWMLLNGNFINDANIDSTRMIGVCMDINDLKESNAIQQRLAAVIEQSSDIIIIFDNHNRRIFANKAFDNFNKFHGFTEYDNYSFLLPLNPERKKILESIYSKLSNKENWNDEIVFKNNGSHITLEAMIFGIFDYNGKITHYVQICRDITDKKLFDEKLRQAQKMEAIGILAGGVAHDFNNILSAIITSSELAKMASPNSSANQYIDLILKASDRAKNITKQILTFSRMKNQDKSVINVNSILDEVKYLLDETFQSKYKINIKSDFKNALVNADSVQLHQVLMNLCTNAYQAMNNTGKGTQILISLSKISKEDLAALNKIESIDRDYVQITVEDDGPGIPNDIVNKIFDPFFTTKKVGEGTGLGLAVTQGIIAGHNGELFVESQVGNGAKFVILLPLSESTKIDDTIDDPDTIKTGNERVLVVDDEEFIANTTKLLLEKYGYTVDSFTDSIEAYDKLLSSMNDYELIILDQIMPNMTGLDLAFNIRKMGNNTPIIICSGYNESFTETTKEDYDIQAILMKPLNKADLLNSIRKVLDESTQS